MKRAALLLALALSGCGLSHDDYLAYRRADALATFVAGMECGEMAIAGNAPPHCQETRHWASMHEAGY